jgi:hypothetical protein
LSKSKQAARPLPLAADLGHSRPRRWLRKFLGALLGGFPGGSDIVARFMRQYEERPTLQTLEGGGPVEQMVCVMAAVAVLDALEDPFGAYLDAAHSGGEDPQSPAGKARLALLRDLQRATAKYGRALGAGEINGLDLVRARLQSRVPSWRRGPRLRPARGLLLTADFGVSHIAAYDITARRRLVARLVDEWCGTPRLTGEDVGDRVRKWRRAAAASVRETPENGIIFVAYNCTGHLLRHLGRLEEDDPLLRTRGYHPARAATYTIAPRPGRKKRKTR